MTTGYVQRFKGKIKADRADVDVVDVAATGLTESVSTGLTASTTQTLAGALALTSKINIIATVGTAGDAVRLPHLEPGQSCEVWNQDATHSAKVFPHASGDNIDGGTAGASVNLNATKRCLYRCVSVTSGAYTVLSAQLGAVSA